MQSIVCDRCRKRITATDIMEQQEAFHYSSVGGYTSKFGDGARYTLDLCNKCWHDLVGEYVQYGDDDRLTSPHTEGSELKEKLEMANAEIARLKPYRQLYFARNPDAGELEPMVDKDGQEGH